MQGASTEETMLAIGRRARAAAHALSLATPEAKTKALRAAAHALRTATPAILAANAKDLEAARAAGRPAAFIDRLMLNEARIEATAKGVEEIAELADPVGTVLAEWTRPNGLKFERVRVPLGVIGIIYESRPNVTADAGALAVKAGNAAILRAGSESLNSALAIHAALVAGLKSAGLPEAAIQLVPTPDRAAVGHMLAGLDGAIDVIVPRGGKSLVERVQKEARVPVFAHLEGLCHTYVDRDADLDMAVNVVLNAKMRRTGVCGATETLLVDSGRAGQRPADAGQGAARRRLRSARRCGHAEGGRPRQAGHRGRLGDRIPRSDHRREDGRRRGRRHRAHRPLRHAAHRRHHHCQHGNR